MCDLDDLDSEWGNFCDGDYSKSEITKTSTTTDSSKAPKCSDIYISTKTKIAYINQPIDLNTVFWKLPITEYHIPVEGIVKKQMKFNSTTETNLNEILSNIPKDIYSNQHIITQIINPEGRIKFRDVRKISIGLCKKDMISYRGKQKGAFYNCFVVILRVKFDEIYREIHVKVFNTGKLEIPGIQTDELLDKVIDLLIKILNDYIDTEKVFDCFKNKCSTVLINSNFRCGYYLNRDKLYQILKSKYRINCSYDSCSYPGIQCEFYYNPALEFQTGQQTDKQCKDVIKVSFMIFRTGSALIVGKCTEYVLNIIYKFLCDVLTREYPNINHGLNSYVQDNDVTAKKTIHKKKIKITIK